MIEVSAELKQQGIDYGLWKEQRNLIKELLRLKSTFIDYQGKESIMTYDKYTEVIIELNKIHNIQENIFYKKGRTLHKNNNKKK